MDIQLKRGLLDVCVLAAIKSEDSYGYKIIKDVKPYIALSESTLYTILKRLETAGLLTVHTAEHDGRLRKYYHITADGRRPGGEVGARQRGRDAPPPPLALPQLTGQPRGPATIHLHLPACPRAWSFPARRRFA